MSNKQATVTAPQHEDPYLQGILNALTRAAKCAHEVARAKGTRVVVRRKGEVVEIEPNPEMYGDI